MSIHVQPPKTYGNFVGGKQVDAAGGATFPSTNPTSGSHWGNFALSSAADVDLAVKNAHAAFSGAWGKLSPTERGKRLTVWGEKIASQAERIGTIESTQNGKLLAEMRLQSTIAEDWLRYFGGLADKIEGSVIPLARQSVLNYTLREPIGVIGVITAWNSPTFLNIMAAAPALAAGNTIVIKPSEVTPASAIEIAQLAIEAGIPEGVVNVVTGLRETGEALVDHPLVRKVSFVGSVGVGREIGARAGRRLITSTLELGGKSPNIVFGDADLDLAEIGVLAGIFAAAGQTCVAGSRAYIHSSVYDQMLERLVERSKTIKLGDPLLADTQMGPIATRRSSARTRPWSVARSNMAPSFWPAAARRQWSNGRTDCSSSRRFCTTRAATTRSSSRKCSARCWRSRVLRPTRKYWNRPTIPSSVSRRVCGPTTFAGPHSMARALQAGTVWINTYRALAFNSPFGGYRSSGTGRNNGIESINQYLQTKSVWCELSTVAQDPFVLRS